MNAIIKINKACAKYERLLYFIVCLLVFEGLLRKVVPAAIGLLIFFLKDLLCLVAIYFISKVRLNSNSNWLYSRWKLLLIGFVPLLIYTAFFDLPLSIFAAKQYLLYVSAGLLVPMAFPESRVEEFKKFAAFFALLLIPTTLIAILQNALPPTHWLNLSIGGESLEAFSSGGFLRVSSTFSFTGQYSWFLNAVCAFMIIGFFLPPSENTRHWTIQFLLPVLLGILLIIGVFITGGRTAVLGNLGCVAIGFILSSVKSPGSTFGKGIAVSIFLIPSFLLLHAAKPEFFAAYEGRSGDTETATNQEQLQGRILGTLFDWTDWFGEQDIASVLIGNGLGIMSNGSDKISTYASRIRSSGLWTEGDMPTTAWEGGVYLLLIWYGFRAAVVLFCFKLWYSVKDDRYAAVSSFLLANVIINGLFGNIGMQPPLALWWWLSVGAIIAIHSYDRASQQSHLKHIYTI